MSDLPLGVLVNCSMIVRIYLMSSLTRFAISKQREGLLDSTILIEVYIQVHFHNHSKYL